MKPGALILGIVISAVLLATAAGLYMMADDQSAQRYRDSVDLVRKIQDLSSSWSIETARVRSDPLADFDSLAAFIPRMARLKERLTETSRLIPDLPARLASDIRSYISLVEAKEERIERFKTGYAVVRNSTRYLPVAAANITRQADEANDELLIRRITILFQNMNSHLATPSDAGKARLSADVEKLRQDSVTYPPTVANTLANLLAHADVLLARKAPTDELFQEATANDTADIADRLTSSFEFEIARSGTREANYDRGVLAAIVVLALFWILLAVHQRVRAGAAATPAAPNVSEAVTANREPDLSVALQREAGLAPFSVEERRPIAAASASSASLNAEAAMLYRFFCERVGTAVADTTGRIDERIKSLYQTHQKINRALQSSEAIVELPDGTDLDEEIEASVAVANHLRREVNGITNLAKRLSSFSGLTNGDVDRDMVDINACIDEVVAATRADRVADVTKRLGEVPGMFASKTEIRLLLSQVLENSVRAVAGSEQRKAVIKIETMRRNDEIVVTIMDNGAGITPDRRKQIFKPFYTSHDGAMGLGLTLAGELVKKYEGGIKVNSLPGRGTVTLINLPTGTPGP